MSHLETVRLLEKYYNLLRDHIPTPRPKSDWKPENKFGFLLGLVPEAKLVHLNRLHGFLVLDQFEAEEDSFIDAMFDYYIRPYHKSYCRTEICQTSSKAASRTPSQPPSIQKMASVPEDKELKHNDMKKAVLKRDQVCLFCWRRVESEAAHIIAQKNVPMPYDQSSLFQDAGLIQKHQIHNGLLLCNTCHSQFDKLKRYVDVVEDRLVVKQVKGSDDPTSLEYMEWESEFLSIKSLRSVNAKYFLDGRTPVEPNGEMALYFVLNDPALLPNRKALQFHKTACLIWKMAGGAEMDDEYCSDDDDLGPVDTAALKRRFNIQDSFEMLHPLTT